MTVRDMIRQLVMYPMDYQVVDTEKSPIMFMKAGREPMVILEPKSQTDIHEWLHDYFRQCIEDGRLDMDAWDELKDQGFTLEDMKNYREDTYKWALMLEDGRPIEEV